MRQIDLITLYLTEDAFEALIHTKLTKRCLTLIQDLVSTVRTALHSTKRHLSP